MNNLVGKKIGDTSLKSICHGLKRRSTSCLENLLMSDAVNVDRITHFLIYKSRKDNAMTNYGMRLDNFESVKDNARLDHMLCEAEAATMAFKTIRAFSTGVAVEKIADAAFTASKILNWSAEKKRMWGNISEFGFKPSNITRRSEPFIPGIPRFYDLCAYDSYVAEASGISISDFKLLVDYVMHIYKIQGPEARIMAGQVVVIEKLIDTAFEASQNLSLCSRQEKPTEEEQAKGKDNTIAPDEISSELTSITDDDSDPYRRPWYEGFMESRDVMSIFMDSDEARNRCTEIRSIWMSASSSIKDWTRITRFIEFKARKEYAMEAYGVRLGDFQSLKKAALMLFEISEAEAENLASETMASDSESIAFEKIADVAFKASKILNWKKKRYSKRWHGDIADAGGFKSPQSLKSNYRSTDPNSYRKNMETEACKAYTMSAFGVRLVDIDIVKQFAISIFEKFVEEDVSEKEAVMMACQIIAIDKIIDALSENLKLSLEMEGLEPRQDSNKPRHWPLIYRGSTAISIFCSDI